MNITTQSTLAEIVKANFRTAGLFESYNLDFCCNGNRSLEKACTDKQLNPEVILEKLESIDTGQSHNQNYQNYDNWKLDFLIDYIVNTHHSYVSRTLPLISAHSLKVKNAHGTNHPEINEIAILWSAVNDELEAHMMKEERMLFPYIKKLVYAKDGKENYETAPFGTVENPISMMEKEHTSAGNALYRIRELSNNYTPPEDACGTFKVFYEELKDFEKDLHTHIHLENNYLHPKAIALENELREKN